MGNMVRMVRMYLLWFFLGFLTGLNGEAVREDPLTKVISSVLQTEEAIKVLPFNELKKTLKTSDSVEITPPDPIESSPKPSKNKIKRQADWPFFPVFNPNLFFNPYFNQISASLFKTLVDQYTNDLEMIKHRQNLVLKYVECSYSDSEKCRKVNQPDETEYIRDVNHWNWGYGGPNVEYVTSDRFYAVMNSFKNAIEKLTLRQNMLYEYIECSCTAKTECSTSMKPVLDVMFSNNGNTTGQLIHSLFVTGSDYNPASSFFQTLASYFSQIPSWFAYNFNPLASFFSATTNAAGNMPPFPTQTAYSKPISPSVSVPSSSDTTVPVSSASYGTSSIQTTESTPATNNYLGSFSSGSEPVHSSSSSFSSTSGSGQQMSGGYVSTGGGGKPSQEQYLVSSNGENIHIFSTDGSGDSISSNKKPEERNQRYAYIPGYGVNPGIAAAGVGMHAGQVGMNAGQVGINAGQVGMNAAQAGIQASQVGANAGIQASQIGISAAQQGMAAGLYSSHVPY